SFVRRAPPGSVLFPYTTLFRSVRACVDAARGADVFVLVEMSHPGGLEYSAKYAEDLARVAARVNAAGIIAPATRPERVRALRAIDRKSTRLNSSHGSISYAVFC